MTVWPYSIILFFSLNVTLSVFFLTPPQNRGGVITPTRNCGRVTVSLQFVFMCVFVCVSVYVFACLCGSAFEQNSSQTNAPIRTGFLLNGCLLHWLGPLKLTSTDIRFLDLDKRSRSHLKMKCHRCGGVCVL